MRIQTHFLAATMILVALLLLLNLIMNALVIKELSSRFGVFHPTNRRRIDQFNVRYDCGV